MGKRAGYFTIIVLAIIPVLAIGLTLGGIFYMGHGQAQIAYEAFSGQKIQASGVLLADKGGDLFLVCLLQSGNTHLISILPSASPKGEQNTTFTSVYQSEGITGVKEKLSKSLSCSIDGYLEVDFSALAPVIDALGGVTLAGKSYTGQAFEAYLNSLPKDSAGAKTQQDGILAVGRRFCSAGFWKAQNGLGKLLRITDTNLSINALMKIGKSLIPALEGEGLQQYCLPEQGNWEIRQNKGTPA